MQNVLSAGTVYQIGEYSAEIAFVHWFIMQDGYVIMRLIELEGTYWNGIWRLSQ